MGWIEEIIYNDTDASGRQASEAEQKIKASIRDILEKWRIKNLEFISIKRLTELKDAILT
jgi:hypothetical protein